jgi:hypothetical protein
VKNRAQRGSLYLAMVRSQLEHCSTVWSPNAPAAIDKLEALQKQAIKWILDEQYCSYSSHIYYLRCKELNLLPIKYKLTLKDLKLFHDILNKRAQIELPNYLQMHTGSTRLRSSHLDELSVVSKIEPRFTRNYNSSDVISTSLSQFSDSFFYRTMNNWNMLPKDIREQREPTSFRNGRL